MDIERRFFSSELRMNGDSEHLTIDGYAAIFNSLSGVIWGFRERIAPGAFTDSINGDDVRALWNHDTGIVLGRTKSGTLRLQEDATGLHIEIDPPASAHSQVESIKRGDVDQMSFGFLTLADEWDEDEEGQMIRTLNKVKLYEVSPVTFPAYAATSVGVRSAYGKEIVIPAEFRRASDLASHDGDSMAQVRVGMRRRRLHLMSKEIRL